MKQTARRVMLAGGLLALAAVAIWLSAQRHKSPAPPRLAPTAPAKPAEPVPAAAVAKPVETAPPPAAPPLESPPVESHAAALKREIGKLNVSVNVRTLMGLNERADDFNARLAALKKLTRTLSRDDAQALKLFLDFRFSEQDPRNRQGVLEFEGLKNDALAVLLEQEQFPEGLGAQLVEFMHDNEHDEVWRNYCVQYLAEYYQRRWPASAAVEPEPSADPPSERRQIEVAYWKALEEKNTQTAGTALLSLEELSRTYACFDRRRVAEAAAALATDDACHETSRITALRVCGMMGCQAALPAARMLAQTAPSVPLRAAAIATLGDLGEPGDAELIESLRNEKDARLRKVAEAAQARLRKRAG